MQAHPVIVAAAAACLLCGGSAAQERPAPLGIFDGQSDIAPTQFVEVLPIPSGPPSINRLDHVAFITTDAPHLLSYLAAKHVTMPERPQHGDDGSTRFDVLDPEGNRIEFVQPPEHPPDIAVNSLSHHMIHVGFIVHSRVREDGLFHSVLGFRPYWFGGMKEDVPSWISQQVPDGTDWLEYMVVGFPEGRGIPPTLGAADLGVLDHSARRPTASAVAIARADQAPAATCSAQLFAPLLPFRNGSAVCANAGERNIS